MISRQDVQRLLHRPSDGLPVLSVFLDMSVNSDNKRTYAVFLNQRRAQYTELDSDRESHHREALGAAFDRVQTWLDEEFDESNRGVAIYAEIGGDWLEALQFPIPVRNRTEIAPHAIVGPLAQIVETHRRHGIIIVDRAHLRMVMVVLGTPVADHEVETQPYPAPHDVHGGGYADKGYQKRKAEEVRHFFKEFALEVAEFDRRYRPDDLVILGIDDNVARFLEFLAPPQRQKVVHTDHAPGAATVSEILERLAPFFLEQLQRDEATAVDLLHERVAQDHLAVAGVHDTLEQLQEGKVDSLILARDAHRTGARCRTCGFYLALDRANCPYCGGSLEDGIDLGEAIIRLAEEQEVTLVFVESEALADLDGAGALLKF